MRKWMAIVLIGLVACSGNGDGPSGPAAKEPPPGVGPECEEEAGKFADGMQALNSRLSIGLTFEDYRDRVSDLQVTFDRDMSGVNGRVSEECAKQVTSPLAKAYAFYQSAFDKWNRCVRQLCEFATVKPKLQALWARATEVIQKARTALDSA